MSKTEILTEAALANFTPYSEVLRYLEVCRLRLGLSKEQMKVLDWGCGRGEAVAWLTQQGYQAVGVDIDSRYIENGKHLFRQRGLEANAILKLIEPTGITDLPDDGFHFVFSMQVLEHVNDLKGVVAELGRITAVAGSNFHSFPAYRHPVEAHLHMPFVHYLPKNRLRRMAIAAWVLLGRSPRWAHLDGKSLTEQARAYAEYSINHTHYRSSGAVQRIFERHGFKVSFVTIDKASWRRLRVADQVARFRLGRALVNWALLTFRSVELVAEKRSVRSAELSGMHTGR